MSKQLDKATSIGLWANIFLFILKSIIGIVSNSIAIISEAVNSLTDIIASIAIKIGVRISKKKPDEGHHFGHNAAQPLAAFIVACFAFVVGIEVIKTSVERIFNPEPIIINFYVYLILGITIITKLFLRFYQLAVDKKENSPALRAAAVDSLNDVLASSIALLGIICSNFGLTYFDGIAGFLVALFILKSGYEIAKENIDFLMGKAADIELETKVKKIITEVNGVKGFNDVRSYFVGDKYHFELHIEVDKNLSTDVSHDIGKKVQHAIQKIENIQQVFVHIDPV